MEKFERNLLTKNADSQLSDILKKPSFLAADLTVKTETNERFGKLINETFACNAWTIAGIENFLH